ncbi:hypothetical protein SAMN05444170_3751 [Bradyrhizobium erythrophlei]|uniref:Uncharacterized protein n=1 Tax=Bradyrhizobium erythrophlei TaxID=1437360 RepID=A0A1M7U6P5_9BRAD|nr:hypothetical protein SAMN05444170_3751 [Bradyrhizobium erythrophlei]
MMSCDADDIAKLFSGLRATVIDQRSGARPLGIDLNPNAERACGSKLHGAVQARPLRV